MEDGDFSNTKAVGAGVSEYKVDFGPGYRIYFGMDGGTLDHPALRGLEEGAARRHHSCQGLLGRLQETQTP